MSSAAGKVAEFIEDCISETLLNVKPSPHFYDTTKFNENNSKVYSVRVGPVSSTNGVIGSVTVNQSFSVELTRSYKTIENSDQKLREEIDNLFSDNEKIMQRLSLRNSSDVQILVISGFTSNEPQIDREKKFVSIEYTYTIQYRMKLIRE